jgi:hypothetical protein
VAEQMIKHPFFASINGMNGRAALEAVLTPHINELESQITFCNDLTQQTNDLINLIFSISQLQETRAAIEESKAANALASSIRRVTMLTFIYLPLTLAAVSRFASLPSLHTDLSRAYLELTSRK